MIIGWIAFIGTVGITTLYIIFYPIIKKKVGDGK